MTDGPQSQDIELALQREREIFMGLELEVGRGALVPRHETELLGRTVIERLKQMMASGEIGPDAVAIDVCCGVGNLACAIAHNLPQVRVFSSDLLETSAELARRNAARLGLAERMKVFAGDLFQPYEGLGIEAKVSAIVCNPPYISTQKLEKERSEILVNEPREAFDAGPYGLAIHQRVCRESPRWLHPGGWLMFEYGAGQGRQVQLVIGRTKRFGQVELIETSSSAPGVATAQLL